MAKATDWWSDRSMDTPNTAPPEVPPISSTAQLRALGWTTGSIRAALNARELERLRRGSYAPPLPDATPKDAHRRLIQATLPDLPPDTILSHGSAALVHGIPVRRAWLLRVSVTRPDAGHWRDHGLVHRFRAPLATDEVVLIDGVALTSLARTAVDLARTQPFVWGVIACDAAMRLGVTRLELQRIVELGRRRSGNVRARACVQFANGASESALESLSRVRMAEHGLPAPELQFEVKLGRRVVARTDFAWPAFRLVGECDGRVKYEGLVPEGETAGDVVERERDRQQLVELADWGVVRWGWDEAWKGWPMASRIRGRMTLRGATA